MAQNAFNLTAQLNLQGPSNIRTVVADIRRQIGTINVDINPTINTTANRNIRDLNTAFRNFNATLAITQANVATTTRSLQGLSQAISAIGSNNAQQTLNNAARAAQNLGNQANNAAQGANAAATGMEQFGRQSALAIRRFAAFSIVTSAVYGLVRAIKSGTDAFIDFDKEFVRLKQVSDSGSASLNLLAKTITNLSTSLGVSSKELTTVSVTLAQAGLSIRDTEKALQALARSALAPSFDNLNDTVEGSIALMRQFGISSNQLESALGSVNAVAAAFAVEAGDLIAAIQRTGGVFATASKGVSEGTDALNEFLAIFTSIRQTTRESAETIATGLRTIFTRIQRGSTIEALKEYGIALTDLENKFVGPFEAVRRLSEGLSRLDPRDTRFSQIVEELGGFRQIGKVIPLIQQFAVAQEALKVAQKGSDSLAKDAATAQLSLANQIAKVREEFLALIRSIGQSESFRSFISLALDLTSGLIKLADAAKTVLPALTALATIRGVSALTQFGAGFAGAFSAAGGARGLGQRLGGGRRFASGGLVPGSGNQDSVDAKLTPGEFVLRKSAVQNIGIGNLRKMNNGGIVDKFVLGGMPKGRGLLGRRGARSRFKELTQEEISQLSTQDMIKYGKRLARNVFTTGGAGIATSSQFVEVPANKITPELSPYLQTYLGKKGFWQEKISPFGRTSNKGLKKVQQKQSRETALASQKARLADEVAARSQEWTSIKTGSPIDTYLKNALKGPALADYLTVKGGGSLSVPYHNTRLRQSVNKALDAYDDFDYSGSNIDKFVTAFAAKKFADGGVVQKFANGDKVLGKRERRIQKGYGAGGVGPLQFGLVGLRSGLNDVESLPTYLQEPLVTPKKRSVQLNIGTLSNRYKKDFGDQIENSLKKSFTSSVLNISNSLAKKIGATPSPSKDRVNRVLEGSGFTSVVGSGLEAALALIGAPYIDKTEATKSLDFPYGLGRVAQLFGSGFPSRVPTDVTRTIGGFGKGKTSILNQIDRFIDATEDGQFTKAFESRISKRSASGLGSRLTAIVSSLGSRSVKDLAAPGMATQLLKKYGLPRGGLGKSSLEKSLRELPQDQQTTFLSDLDQVVKTGRFASGGSTNTALALLTPGEAVIDPVTAKSIGYGNLKRMNYADKYASGGSVSIVPGSGNGDTFGPVPLPVGSFVLRKKATKALGLNKGGIVQKFAEGGNVEEGGGFSFSSLFNNFGLLTGALLGLTAGVLALRNNFTAISGSVQNFGRSIGLARNSIGFPRTGTGTARPGGARAGLRNFANQGAAIPAGGGFGGIGSFIALTAGGTAISGLGSLFDEKDKTGGVQTQALVTNALGDALNYGTIGATIGSAILPGFGTVGGGVIGALIGGAAGLATGFIGATKATEEYEKAQMEASVEENRKKQAQKEQEEAKKRADAAQKQIEEFQRLAQISANLADTYNRANAYLDRFGSNLEEISRVNVGRLSDLSGQGRLGQTSRADEQLLQNLSAYSSAEVNAVAQRIAGLAGGGTAGSELAQTVRAQKIIQEQLPTILRTTQSADVSGAILELKTLLRNELGQQLSGPVNTIINEINTALGKEQIRRTGEGANIQELADNIEKIIGPVAESAQKVATNLLNQYNNALDKSIELQNEWISVTEKANEINRKASQIRISAELDLKKALGIQISPAEANAPFEQNIRQLTSGLVRGGTTDPNLIGQRINQLIQQNSAIESRIEGLKSNIGAGGPAETKQINAAIQAQQEALARNKIAINEGTKALEELAFNGSKAANAISRIQVKQQQAKSFVELIRNVSLMSPQQRMEFTRQTSALQQGRAALASGRGVEFFSDQQRRQDFFAGLDQFREIFGPRLAAQIEQGAINAIVQAGGVGLNVQFPSGVTVGEVIGLGTTGQLPAGDQDLQDLNDAVGEQERAAAELEKLSREAAENLKKQIDTIFASLKDIFNSLDKATADLKKEIETLRAARAGARSKGGPIYASRGKLVEEGFKPRGKDTVPAQTPNGTKYMLQPGEFVVNKDATNKNYNLLKAINNGDNVSGMYAAEGGSIRRRMLDERKQAYLAEKEERRQRFRERNPGLARLRDQKEARELRYEQKGLKTELEDARDEAFERGNKTRTQAQYQLERGQKLFSKFFASTDGYDDYYGELSPDIVFKDLRATSESPVGYSSLSLEDKALADIAIDKFIKDYESKRPSAVDLREGEKRKQEIKMSQQGLRIAQAIEALQEEIVTPQQLGLRGLIDPVAGEITPKVLPDVNGNLAIIGATNESLINVRDLTVEEKDKLRRKKLQRQFAEIDARSQAERETLANRRQKLAAQRAELDNNRSLDQAARNQINPYTGKPFKDRFEQQAIIDRASQEDMDFEQIAARRQKQMDFVNARAAEANARRAEEFQRRTKNTVSLDTPNYYNMYGPSGPDPLTGADPRMANMLDQAQDAEFIRTSQQLTSLASGGASAAERIQIQDLEKQHGPVLAKLPNGNLQFADGFTMISATGPSSGELALAASEFAAPALSKISRPAKSLFTATAKELNSLGARFLGFAEERTRGIRRKVRPVRSRTPSQPTKPPQVRSQKAAVKAYEEQAASIDAATDRKIAEFIAQGGDDVPLPVEPSVRQLASVERVAKVDQAMYEGWYNRVYSQMGEMPEFSTVPDIPTTPRGVRSPTRPTRPTRTQPQGPTDFSRRPTKAQEVLPDYKERDLASKYGENPSRIDIAEDMGPIPLASTPSATPVASTGLFPTFRGPLASASRAGASAAVSAFNFLSKIGATPISGPTILAAIGTATSYFGKRAADKMKQYNAGGMVQGKSGIDNVEALLTRGEFVVNATDAANNLEALRYINNGGVIKPKRMAEGGDVGGVSRTTSSPSSFGGSYTLSLEDKSITFMQTFSEQLNTFGKDFSSYVTQLSQINIPDKIEMVGRHSVEVNVNGAAAFEAIEEGVRSLINTEIGKKMNMLWNQSNGQLGESIPTGDFNVGSTGSQV